MKTPVCWLAQCFVHTVSGDVDEYEHTDGHHVGYLRHQRSQGVWLANLRGCGATAQRETNEPAWQVGDTDIARRALGKALGKLRRRVEFDRKWLAMIDEEIG